MKERAKIIVNPAAGAGSTSRAWPSIQARLEQSGLAFDFSLTQRKDHATELAKAAVESGYGFVVAVGGDGTIQEVVNGILQTPVSKQTASTDTILGIICTGTGSDLSRSVGISRKIEESCHTLVRRQIRRIDVGFVTYHKNGKETGRYFVNSAGIGFDAAVVEATEKLPKYIGGTIPYLLGLIRSFLFYKNKWVSITVDGKPGEPRRVMSVVVANGRYFGGGMHVAPVAKMDDGLFDIVTIGDFGKVELLRVFPRVYKGSHLTYPKISLTRGTVVTIESPDQYPLQADGEVLGNGPVSFQLIPDAISLIV
jgi:diacylglycerol kinase (ATP)